jgi:hypothetical protein
MSDTQQTIQKPGSTREPTTRKPLAGEGKQPWETPKLEDVSEEVMAQPYIRFT